MPKFRDFCRRRDVREAQGRRRPVKLVLACGLICSAGSAQAHSLALIAPSSSVQLIASLSQTSNCFQYSYDQNGNRISSSTTPFASGSAVWGSSTYGCAVWGT